MEKSTYEDEIGYYDQEYYNTTQDPDNEVIIEFCFGFLLLGLIVVIGGNIYHFCDTKCKQMRLSRKLKQVLITEDLSEECPICLENYVAKDKKVILTCSHEFHKQCVTKWFNTNEENTCPLCRNNI